MEVRGPWALLPSQAARRKNSLPFHCPLQLLLLLPITAAWAFLVRGTCEFIQQQGGLGSSKKKTTAAAGASFTPPANFLTCPPSLPPAHLLNSWMMTGGEGAL